MSYLFTFISYLKKTYTTTAQEPSIHTCEISVIDFPFQGYSFYKKSKTCSPLTPAAAGAGDEFKTFLKVGQTSADCNDITPFTIEWIPDMLPRTKVGELRIVLKYGHLKNGQLDLSKC